MNWRSVMTGLVLACATLPARGDELLTATLITLDVQDAEPQRVIDQMSEQSDGRVALMPESRRSVEHAKATFDLAKQPFWVVMREVCRAYGLTPREQGTLIPHALPLVRAERNLFQAPHIHDGPFLIALTNVFHSRSMDLIDPNSTRAETRITFQVAAEPKVQVVAYDPVVIIDAAEDETGQSLTLQTVASETLQAQQVSIWSVAAQLNDRASRSEKLAVLRGRVRVEVQTQTQRLEVDDILQVRDAEHTAGPVRATLHELVEDEDAYTLKLTLSAGEVDLMRAGRLLQGMQLLDAQGRTLFCGSPSGRGNANGYAFDCDFRRNIADFGPPAKLIWEITTGTQEIEVPFEFRDVPLN